MLLVRRFAYAELTLLAFLLAQGPVVSAQPTNDLFANALPLAGLPVLTSGSNSVALKESGEPDHERVSGSTDAGGSSVWWTWTAPATGTVIVETCGSRFSSASRSLLSVYTGAAVDALVRVPGIQRGGCRNEQAVAIAANAGTTYHIAVDGRQLGGFATTGSIVLGIREPAPNDAFADATPIAGSSAVLPGHNILTDKETGEPDHSGRGAGLSSVWWQWTAPASGPVRLTTCDSAADDTFLAVYTGTMVDALAQVAQNDDSCAGRSALGFDAVSSVTYSIAVDSASPDPSLTLRLGPPPANDDFTDAAVLVGSPAMGSESNLLATRETGEPRPESQNSLWWSWTAPSTGPFTIDTCNSDFDTVLTLYTGNQVDGLSEVVTSDDGCGAQSQVTLNAVGSTVYRIQVGGFFNTATDGETAEVAPDAGTVTLHVAAGAAGPPVGPPGQVDFLEAATSPLAGPGGPFAVGDFNTDQIADIARADNTVPTAPKIQILLGNGACGFAPAPSSPVALSAGLLISGVAAGHLDGAHTDLVTSHDNGSFSSPQGGWSVLLGNGTAGFVEAAASPTIDIIRRFDPTVIDVDGLASNDVLLGVHGGVDVLLGDGTGALASAGIVFQSSSLQQSGGWAAADLDDNGDLDLALGDDLSCCPGEESSVEISKGNGDGTFTLWSSFTTRTNLGTGSVEDLSPAITAGDLDDDQIPDLVAVDLATHVLLSNGALLLRRAPGGILKPYRTTSNVRSTAAPLAVDLDLDLDLDLVFRNLEGLHVLLNDGTGQFTAAETGPEAAFGSPTAVDCDGDGDQDLLVLGSAGEITILLNQKNTPSPGTTPTPTSATTPSATPTPLATPTAVPEICDNCLDDDLDTALDRDDGDCPARADGGTAGLGDPKGRGKAATKCTKATTKAGAKYAGQVLKHLDKCVNAVFKCLQEKPGDATCLAKAAPKCAKELTAIAGKDEPKLRRAIAKSCGDTKVAPADLLAAAGVGYGTEAALCNSVGVPTVNDADDVADCLVATHTCRAAEIFGMYVPRAFELLTLGGRNPASELPCLPPGTDGGGLGLDDPKGRGKAAAKCEKIMKKEGAKYVKSWLKTVQKCSDKIYKCVETKDQAGPCIAKAQGTCAKQAIKLFAPGKGLEAKLVRKVEKGCGAAKLPVADLFGARGLGLEGHLGLCIALGLPAPASAGDVARCIAAQHRCRAEQLLERAFPRLDETLTAGGLDLTPP